MKSIVCQLAFLLLLVGQHTLAENNTWARQTLDLNTHVSVQIDASAETIWPHILNASKWKQGAVLVLLDGKLGEPGAVHKAVDRREMKTPLFYVQDVELYPDERRTMKLYSTEGILMGFASYYLEPMGQMTRVSYHVYSESPFPPQAIEGRSEAEIEALQRQYTNENRRRFQAELESLKRLVES